MAFDERKFRHRTWTDEQLAQALKESQSIEQLSRKLGLKSASAGHRTLPKHIKRLKLDASHLIGRQRSGNRTKIRWNKLPLIQILTSDSEYSSKVIKRRLIEEGLLIYECASCKIKEWNGKHLVLQIEHKNGKHNDNRLENLELLCPNCHSQTSTFAGRNKNKGKGEIYGNIR